MEDHLNLKMAEDNFADESADLLPKHRKAKSQRWLIVLLLVSNTVTFIISSRLSEWIRVPWPQNNVQHDSASLRSGISNTQHTTTFTGLKYIPNNFSALPGGDIDVDAAWSSIGTYIDRLLITPDEATSFPEITSASMLLTPESIISGPKSPLPYTGYPVFVEGLHQLHCVDLMRQALYFNADYYRARGEGVWKTEEKWIRNHVSHCMDYLRRLAMCHAETGLITFSWRNAKGEYTLDYEQTRQCGDWEKVLSWTRERELDFNNGDVVLQPPEGAVFKDLAS